MTRSGEISTSESEWCGFMSELKKTLLNYGKSIRTLIERQTQQVVKRIDERHVETTESLRLI